MCLVPLSCTWYFLHVPLLFQWSGGHALRFPSRLLGTGVQFQNDQKARHHLQSLHHVNELGSVGYTQPACAK